ncbi:MAG: (2Fe-2S) ferredoxin domain-containing protein [Alphaproteobacteria bacterium]
MVFFYYHSKIREKKECYMTVVKVCLGSSCYVRGNDKILSFLEGYIQKHQKEMKIEIIGCRCTNLCQEGPNIFIDNKKYSGLNQTELEKILETL